MFSVCLLSAAVIILLIVSQIGTNSEVVIVVLNTALELK